MPAKLFIPQLDIDRWMSSGAVDLRGDALSAKDGSFQLQLRPASLFLRVVGDGSDRRGLLGKVKDEDALSAIGAEAYMTSVLFDDAAYDVEAGFLATLGEVPGGNAMVLAMVRSLAAK
jgi:hypothetical protein